MKSKSYRLPSNAKGSWIEDDTCIHWCDLEDIDRIMHRNIREHWHVTSKKDLVPLSPIEDDQNYFNPWS